VHVAELEENNAKLLAELEQSRLAHAEAETARNSMSMNHGKFEEECAGLHADVETLEQEKAGAVAAHDAEHKKFQDYRVHHHKKLRKLHVNLERAVNEIGMRCLLYHRKGSAISEIIEWFDKDSSAAGCDYEGKQKFLMLLPCQNP
jgi:hypothetical protein